MRQQINYFAFTHLKKIFFKFLCRKYAQNSACDTQNRDLFFTEFDIRACLSHRQFSNRFS